MADAEEIAEEEPKKGSKKGLLIGIVLALVLGGGGFFAVYSGMILGPHVEPTEEMMPEIATPLPDVDFVPIDPLIINLGRGASGQHLRFKAQLEVGKLQVPEVIAIMPRIVDVLNGYLRAVDMRDLEDPAALIRLRAQMLRRVQIVAGDGRIRDLLIMEFVLN